MANVSQKCRMLEKHKYWTGFQPTRHKFFKIMIGSFLTQLRIPRKFMSNFKDKLSDTISLSGPSGSMWTVKLLTTDEDVLFLDGWADFVKDHSLAEEDFLVFCYSGNSTFEVTIFDRSGCEREGAYFVKKHTSSCSKKKCAMELDELQVVETSEDWRCSSQKKQRGADDDKRTRSPEVQMTSKFDRKKKRRIHSASQIDVLEKFNPNEDEDSEEFEDASEGQQPKHHKGKKRGVAQSSKSVHLKPKPEKKGNMESPLIKKQWYSYYYISGRREVTEKEKERAHKSAILYSSPGPSLLVIMKPTYVYKYFSMSIPREWVNKHVSTKDLEIQLRVPSSNKKWIVRFQNTRWKCALTRGWSKFVMDNNLEEHDVCIFKLNQGGKANKKTVIWDVIIFRVVDELVPLRRSLNPN